MIYMYKVEPNTEPRPSQAAVPVYGFQYCTFGGAGLIILTVARFALGSIFGIMHLIIIAFKREFIVHNPVLLQVHHSQWWITLHRLQA